MKNLPIDSNDKYIAYWLIVCAATIFAMILLGGITRLTHSGLSMVEWKPVTGVIPPLTDNAWQLEFEKYKAYPEYQKINVDMILPEFKAIYYFEYAHRVLGRFIGILFLLPFLFFYLTKRVTKSLTPKLITIFILGGLQGLLGWYMVKSGLINEPQVSQYRLTAHLGAAVIIYAYIIWVVYGLLLPSQSQYSDKNRKLYFTSLGLTVLVITMILSGGFVAGTRAGFAYNTFPLMAGKIIPEGLFILQPWWSNFFDNIVTVQFNHRLLAYVIAIFATFLGLKLLRSKPENLPRIAIHTLFAMLIIQITLGVATLIYSVPVILGAAHQSGAILLFTIALFISHRLKIEIK